MLGEPVQGMQVAQAAFAVLDIRLDQISRGAGASMAGVLLSELGLDERPRIALEHLLAEAMLEIGVKRLSPRISRASSSAVRMVMSEWLSRTHWSMVRVAWPTLKPRSQSR